MPTRQTSSSGRPKSPRIQVVLPEDLCDRLAALADLEARTVSNMARVLIQQGVERLERLQEGELVETQPPAPASTPRSVRAGSAAATRSDRSRSAAARIERLRRDGSANSGASNAPMGQRAGGERLGGERLGGANSRGTPSRTDRFRAELERQGQEPSRPAQKPRRLRIWRPN